MQLNLSQTIVHDHWTFPPFPSTPFIKLSSSSKSSLPKLSSKYHYPNWQKHLVSSPGRSVSPQRSRSVLIASSTSN
ncbi:hypothetical protein M422DRAFT_39800 [Sphaerobolus stellatus SS14]|uniref:Uncharacterized protein n=1 Tax=Sphaerobolus stellatus (strain SS14) TaxID=990650 RepID=A0A0C9UDB3_SPHS4|nr:hypothetical protein M422DRAFT_39800 [Sphaerobolus stellatus SS14]